MLPQKQTLAVEVCGDNPKTDGKEMEQKNRPRRKKTKNKKQIKNLQIIGEN